MSPKARLIQEIRKELEQQLERLTQAAKEAHAAATDPDAKAESKYDTRSLEDSYLASGQARQVVETQEALGLLESFSPKDCDLTDAIEAGALVEITDEDEASHFLLAPSAGGMTIDHDGRSITLISPSSALYQELVGHSLGDSLEDGRLVTEVE